MARFRMAPVLLTESFSRLSRRALAHPKSWLAATLFVTLLAGVGLYKIRVRTDGAALRPSQSEARSAPSDRELFHDPSELIAFVTRSNEAPSFASPEGFQALSRWHDSLEKLEGLHPAGVFSLGTIPHGMPSSLSLPFPSLLDSLPSEREAFDERWREVLSDPLAPGLFVSKDGEAAAFYVNFESDVEAGEAIERLEKWIDTNREPGYDVRLLGPLVVERTLGDHVLANLAVLIPIVLAVVAALLFFFLRSAAGVAVPLAEALLILITTFGLMGWFGAPVTLVTTILPVLLMTMGITDEIHLLERVRQHLSSEERRPSIEKAVDDVGPALIMTSLTTALAFLSFSSATIAPLRDFGLFAAFGILYALFLTFTFVPAFLATLPSSWLATQGRDPQDLGPGRLERAAVRRGGVWPAAAFVLLVVLAVPGILRLTVEDSWIDNFDPDSDLVRADREFNERFWGTYRFDVVFEADSHFYFYNPEGARLMERFAERAAQGPAVGGVFHYLVPLEQVAEEFNYTIPVSGLSEYGIRRLGEGAEIAVGYPLMSLLVRRLGAIVRARIFVPDADHAKGVALERYLDSLLPGLLQGTNLRFRFGGDLPEAMEVVRSVVGNQLRSIGWTLLGIMALLLLTLRSLKRVLVLILPVVCADAILLGALGLLDVPIGIATSLFASLTIGVGVDYAIHLDHAFRSRLARGVAFEEAAAGSLSSAGRAIRWNALTLGVGFLVLAFSTIPPNRALGLLLAASMIVSWAATIVLVPRFFRRADS
jgi:hypothetical protein